MKKKLLPVLLSVCMIVSLLSVAWAADFSDVDGNYGQAAIERWSEYGVLNGNGDGTFDPSRTMTRAQFAQMMVNLMGYTESSRTSFTDVDPNEWYADAIGKLIAAGVMQGNGDGTANPNGEVTREQAAVMFCRAFGLKPSGNSSLTFADSGSVNSWARDAMVALAERGMINGVGNNLLSPGGNLQRAAAAQMLSNMVAEYVTTPGQVITGNVDRIIIVAKGGSVDIRNATVTQPIVVENASVTLTNTKAGDVKVAGNNASITADASSSVGEVSLSGNSPKADIKGSVESVTIEEGTTGASANVPAGTTVTNESGSPASVNGSTVDSGTTAPAPEASGSGSVGGSSAPAPGGDTTPPSASEETPKEDPEQPEPDDPTQDEVPEDKAEGGDSETHATADDCAGTLAQKEDDPRNRDATCSEFGQEVYECSACGRIVIKSTAKVAHTKASEKNTANSVAATCGTDGYDSFDCSECGTQNAFIEKTNKGGDHTPGNWWYNESQHGKQCTVCGQWTIEKTSHVEEYTKINNSTHKVTCEDCGYTITASEEHHLTYTNNTGDTHDVSCSDGCGYSDTDVAHTWTANENTECVCGKEKPEESEEPVPHVHDWGNGKSGDDEGWTPGTPGQHTRTCNGAGNCTAATSGTCDTNNNGACSKCGYKPAPTECGCSDDCQCTESGCTCKDGGSCDGTDCDCEI